MSTATAPLPTSDSDSRPEWRPALHAALLLLGSLLLIREEIPGMMVQGFRDTEAAHLVAAPILIALLWWRRRRDLPVWGPRPNGLGILLMLFGVFVFTLAAFPFNYQQPRRAASAILVAGAFLTAGGWTSLRFWWPMIVLLALAIPIGVRFYARFVVRPETLTLQAVQTTLDMLPNIDVELNGLDITYMKGTDTNTIAAGAPNRGAQVLLGMLSLSWFIIFSRVRPFWQTGVALCCAIPIILLCNYFRLLTWGVVTIGFDAHPLDPTPQRIAFVAAFGSVYLAFLALLFVLEHLTVSEPSPAEETS